LCIVLIFIAIFLKLYHFLFLLHFAMYRYVSLCIVTFPFIILYYTIFFVPFFVEKTPSSAMAIAFFLFSAFIKNQQF